MATAEVISVGTELLLGETVDTNAAYLGSELAQLGLALRRTVQLPDDRAALTAGFRDARSRADLVAVTGGLGPTHDDLTREALADALGEQLVLDPGLEATLRDRFRRIGPMAPRNLQQVMLIPSAEPLDNPIGSAPGWWVDRDGSVVVLLPGVPSEMRRMWSEQVVQRLAHRFDLRPLHKRVVRCYGIGESAAAAKLGDLLGGDDPVAGIYARDDGIHIRFSTRGDPATLERLVEQACIVLGDDVYGTDDTGVAEATLRALAAGRVRTLATTERGTGGSLAAALTERPATDGLARFAGGVVLADDAARVPPPRADVTLSAILESRAEGGRSVVRIGVSGALSQAERRVTVFGSGPQRLRRAAFAALDQLRRLAVDSRGSTQIGSHRVS